MNKLILTIAVIASSAVVATAQKQDAGTDSLSYYIGATQGASFGHRLQEDDAKTQAAYKKEFLKGFKETLLGDTSRSAYREGLSVGLGMISEINRIKEAGAVVDTKKLYETFVKFYELKDVDEAAYSELFQGLRKAMEPTQAYFRNKAEAQRQAEESARNAQLNANIAAGKKYVDSLKSNDPEVRQTESGLVYKVVRRGEGPTVGSVDGEAMVRYVGKLVDGTQFDASGPNAYRMNPKGVIPGFAEGLRMMNKGAKYVLYIPQELAYGPAGPPSIGPGQTLIFEVDVDDVISPQAK